MADEPNSPQQAIDDAAKALEQTPVLPTPEVLKENILPTSVAPVLEIPTVEDTKTVLETEQPKVEFPPSPDPLPEVSIPEQKPIDVPVAPIMEASPPLPPVPEPMIIPTKEKEERNTAPPGSHPIPEKKKSGKGLLIATLLFFIFTLPIALYYVTQSPQFAEIRSRAAGGTCSKRTTTESTCWSISCSTTSETTCKNMGQGLCCQWKTSTVTNTPIKTPTKTPTKAPTPTDTTGCVKPGNACNHDNENCCGSNYCQYSNSTSGICKPLSGGRCCNKYTSATSINTCYGASENACGINDGQCTWQKSGTCPVAKTPTPGGPVGGPVDGPVGGPVGRPEEGKFHNCGYLHNTGSSGPPQSGCDSTNCGNKPCGVFTYKCGKYCLNASCGKAACYDDPPRTPTVTAAPTATLGPTATVEPTAEPTNPPAELGQCDASCGSDANCESGLSCSSATGVKRCRNADCPDQSDCSCPISNPTAIPTRTYVTNYTAIPTRAQLIARAPTSTPTEVFIVTPTNQPTPKIPVAGVGPGIFGAISVAGSILLLLIGLIL